MMMREINDAIRRLHHKPSIQANRAIAEALFLTGASMLATTEGIPVDQVSDFSCYLTELAMASPQAFKERN
jgi:hypothetical protein